MNTHGILVSDGLRFTAFQYHGAFHGDLPEIQWQGIAYSRPQYSAEWEEILNATGKLVGVYLGMARHLHPAFCEWLRRFRNVYSDGHDDPRIFFDGSDATLEEFGPMLPVNAYQGLCNTSRDKRVTTNQSGNGVRWV